MHMQLVSVNVLFQLAYDFTKVPVSDGVVTDSAIEFAVRKPLLLVVNYGMFPVSCSVLSVSCCHAS